MLRIFSTLSYWLFLGYLSGENSKLLGTISLSCWSLKKYQTREFIYFQIQKTAFTPLKRERNSPSIVFGRRAHLLHFSVKWAYFHAFIRFITFLYKNINKNSNVNTWKFSISEIIEGSKMHFKSLTIPSLISMTSWWPWSGWLNLPKERKLKSEFLIPKPSFRVWPQRKKSVS